MAKQLDSDHMLLEGIVSIQAALTTNSRRLSEILIAKTIDRRKVFILQKMAKAANIPVRRRERKEIDEMATGATHGGVIAVAGSRQYLSLQDLWSDNADPFFVMLDGIEDPYTFGYSVRSLYAAGAQGMVVSPRNWKTAETTVVRASAGASELLPMAQAHIQDAVSFFREQHCAVVLASGDTKAASVFDTDMKGPIFVIIGGEHRGIKRSYISDDDVHVTIPYARAFNQSLNTAAAAGIIGFEIRRQRS